MLKIFKQTAVCLKCDELKKNGGRVLNCRNAEQTLKSADICSELVDLFIWVHFSDPELYRQQLVSLRSKITCSAILSDTTKRGDDSLKLGQFQVKMLNVFVTYSRYP